MTTHARPQPPAPACSTGLSPAAGTSGGHLANTVDPGIRERQANAPGGFADVIGGATRDETPHWAVTFTVADRDAAAARAGELGGTVVATTEDGWTRKAVLRDPDGFGFTTSQLTPPDGC